MFAFQLNLQSKPNWKYGPVTSTLIPLEEIDPLMCPGGDSSAIISRMIANSQEEMLMNQSVVKILAKKWEKYAGFMFYVNFARSFVTTVCLSLGLILHPNNKNGNEYDFDYWQTYLRIFCELVVCTSTLFKTVVEFREIKRENFDLLKYYDATGYAFMENVLSSLYICLLWPTILLRVFDSPVYLIFGCLTGLVSWSYLTLNLLGFEATGPFLVMMAKMLKGDVSRFVLIYTVFLGGFSMAIFIIEAPNELYALDTTGISQFMYRLVQLFYVMLGAVDLPLFLGEMDPGYQNYAMFLYTCYIITVTIMLLNLLIAMMGNTYGKVDQEARQVWHRSYAEIILSMEAQIGHGEIVGNDKFKYWVYASDAQGVKKPFLETVKMDEHFLQKEADQFEEKVVQQNLARALSGNNAEQLAEAMRNLIQTTEQKSAERQKKRASLMVDNGELGPRQSVKLME